jgi:hypothetical protein
MLLVGVGYEWIALRMPRGNMAYPGPGLYPVLVGVFFVVTAGACLAQDLLAHRRVVSTSTSQPTAAQGSDRAVRKTYQLTALTILYILLLKPIGYPICMCGFLAAAIRIFGFRRWIPTVLLAVVIAAVSYVSFVVWLKVPLPLGILDDVLG